MKSPFLTFIQNLYEKIQIISPFRGLKPSHIFKERALVLILCLGLALIEGGTYLKKALNRGIMVIIL